MSDLIRLLGVEPKIQYRTGETSSAEGVEFNVRGRRFRTLLLTDERLFAVMTEQRTSGHAMIRGWRLSTQKIYEGSDMDLKRFTREPQNCADDWWERWGDFPGWTTLMQVNADEAGDKTTKIYVFEEIAQP